MALKKYHKDCLICLTIIYLSCTPDPWPVIIVQLELVHSAGQPVKIGKQRGGIIKVWSIIYCCCKIAFSLLGPLQGGQRSGSRRQQHPWSWQGFSVLLKDTSVEWILTHTCCCLDDVVQAFYYTHSQSGTLVPKGVLLQCPTQLNWKI